MKKYEEVYYTASLKDWTQLRDRDIVLKVKIRKLKKEYTKNGTDSYRLKEKLEFFSNSPKK